MYQEFYNTLGLDLEIPSGNWEWDPDIHPGLSVQTSYLPETNDMSYGSKKSLGNLYNW